MVWFAHVCGTNPFVFPLLTPEEAKQVKENMHRHSSFWSDSPDDVHFIQLQKATGCRAAEIPPYVPPTFHLRNIIDSLTQGHWHSFPPLLLNQLIVDLRRLEFTHNALGASLRNISAYKTKQTLDLLFEPLKAVESVLAQWGTEREGALKTLFDSFGATDGDDLLSPLLHLLVVSAALSACAKHVPESMKKNPTAAGEAKANFPRSLEAYKPMFIELEERERGLAEKVVERLFKHPTFDDVKEDLVACLPAGAR
ncbi:hypothetical protein JCM8547_007424 [Rhodosporidiobolus lusitaniae]